MTDVVVIGSGAGGGALAWALSRSGMQVLVLEKGRRYHRRDFLHDEIQMALDNIFVPSIETDPHVLVDADTLGEPVATTLGWTASCVGGGTVHMGACLYRFHEDDFRLRSRVGDFEAIADWPYRYADLEPYYCRAEAIVGVAGLPSGSRIEAFRSQPLPMPPLRRHALAEALERACERRDLQPFVTPRAMNSEPYSGRPACWYCHFCAGYGCPTGARGSAQETFLNRAVRTGRCRVWAQAMVRKVTVDKSGRATGCVFIDRRGYERKVRAAIVCICCSAVESARLLLLSASRDFPEGLANRSGLVGRHLQFHTVSAGKGLFRAGRSDLHDTNALLGVSVGDYYFGHNGTFDLPKGGLLRFDLKRLKPIAVAQAVARPRSGEIIWGDRLKHRLIERFIETREVEFEVFQDFIPNSGTFVELDSSVKDQWGLPVARLHLKQVAHHRQAGQWLVDKGLEILRDAGSHDVQAEGIGAVSRVMVHGTCRAGHDRKRSVLNQFCQMHDVRNLFVVDGSFMPTSGGAPSTLTIMANSLRTADYIVDRARAGDLA